MNYPLQPNQCNTCPFREGADARLKAKLQIRVVAEANQLCHHPRLSGKSETHLCRGARDYQLEIFYRLGLLEAPTDAAWEKALVKIQQFSNE